MNKIYTLWLIYFVCIFCVHIGESIPVPATEENLSSIDKNITTVIAHNENRGDPCPSGMTRYFERAAKSWVCDCLPEMVYFAKTEACYEVFKRGPCEEGEYLVFLHNEKVAKCETNPCQENEVVPFIGTCHRLNEQGSCAPGILRINPTNFQLECHSTTAVDTTKLTIHAISILRAPSTSSCPMGGRRDNQGLCRITV